MSIQKLHIVVRCNILCKILVKLNYPIHPISHVNVHVEPVCDYILIFISEKLRYSRIHMFLLPYISVKKDSPTAVGTINHKRCKLFAWGMQNAFSYQKGQKTGNIKM